MNTGAFAFSIIVGLITLEPTAAAASCENGGVPAYEDVTYVQVSRHYYVGDGQRFILSVSRGIHLAPEGTPGIQTYFNAELKQQSGGPVPKGSFALKEAQALFSRVVALLNKHDFFGIYFAPLPAGHFSLDGPRYSITVDRCGVRTTVSTFPADHDDRIPHLDDAHAKPFFSLIDDVRDEVYAWPWIETKPENTP